MSMPEVRAGKVLTQPLRNSVFDQGGDLYMHPPFLFDRRNPTANQYFFSFDQEFRFGAGFWDERTFRHDAIHMIPKQ